MKNIRIVHGTLMYPLEVGSRALIFEEGRYFHISTVIAIHGVTPRQIRFETMNSHYRSKGTDVSEAGAMPSKRQAGAGRNSSGQAEIQLCLQGIQPKDGKAPDGQYACAGTDLSGSAGQ